VLIPASPGHRASWTSHPWRLARSQPCTSQFRRAPGMAGSAEAGRLAPIAIRRGSPDETVRDFVAACSCCENQHSGPAAVCFRAPPDRAPYQESEIIPPSAGRSPGRRFLVPPLVAKMMPADRSNLRKSATPSEQNASYVTGGTELDGEPQWSRPLGMGGLGRGRDRSDSSSTDAKRELGPMPFVGCRVKPTERPSSRHAACQNGSSK
jgi:hypothetical protein